MPAWTDTLERQLLLNVIHSASVSKINWDQVALLMGDGFTASAVSQKFTKIKKATEKEAGEVGDVAKGSVPKGKPKPRAGAAGGAKKVASKRTGKNEVNAGADDSEEESPKKKFKVKPEEDGEGEEEGDLF